MAQAGAASGEATRGPLSGVRVADFSHLMAGPWCAMTLADMGAEVIKVEPPEGDPARGLMRAPGRSESAFFLGVNRNKLGIVLDLHSEGGRAAALDLVAASDVLVESYASGVMERLGLGHEALCARHPRLVYCSVSAYGREGPFAARAGYDPIVQAETGLMHLNAHPGGAPHKAAVPIVDLGAGMYAAQAVLAALYTRERSGCGQRIDVPLFDTAASFTSFHGMAWLVDGRDPQPTGNGSEVAAPVGLYRAADGSFYMTVAGDRVWRKLLAALGEPQTLAQARFVDNAARVRRRDELDALLQTLFEARPLAHWLDALRAAGVPAAPVRSIAEAAASAEWRASGCVAPAPHASLGQVPHLRLPMRLSGTPLALRRAAPLLGEHTRAVLGGLLGYAPARVQQLLTDGAAQACSR